MPLGCEYRTEIDGNTLKINAQTGIEQGKKSNGKAYFLKCENMQIHCNGHQN